ncbi:Uncharacterised protein [Vibrio cholerae]|nr:Uncharacterised protein [Vibrio cholerae]
MVTLRHHVRWHILHHNRAATQHTVIANMAELVNGGHATHNRLVAHFYVTR